MEDRWIEVQFYLLMVDLFIARGDFKDIIRIIDLCTAFGQYDTEKIKHIAVEATALPELRPHRDEFIVLAFLNSISKEYILKKVRCDKRYYTRTINKTRKNPMCFKATLAPEKIIELTKFIKAYYIFRKVGVTDVFRRRPMGHIQRVRYGSDNHESLRLI